MTSTAVLTEDSATVISDTPTHFDWGVAIAGAIAAVAVTFFLITLGAGVGLALASPRSTIAAGTVLTLGAVYFFAAQAFGFTVGGYLVGRLIGPEAAENHKEEEFRAAAHGLVMWALAVVAGLLIAGFSSTLAGSAMAARPVESAQSYWIDTMFLPASNAPQVAADKAEAARISARDLAVAGSSNDADTTAIAQLVARDAGISMPAAMARVSDAQIRMRQDADAARKAASIVSLWTAFALLFGAILSVAASISARWMDDRITFSMAPRRKL